MSNLFTLRTGAGLIPEDGVLQVITDLVATGGVLRPSVDFIVAQQTVADMTVKTGGNGHRAYIKGATGNAYPVNSDGSHNITITANSSGNPRIDSIILYIDKAVVLSSTDDGRGVAKLVAVAGTPAGSPTAPDSTAIGAAIGASNPYIVLANVSVASGATSITTANITDMRSAVTVNLSNIIMPELATAPSTPALGYASQFVTTNGLPAYKGDDGIIRPMGEDAIKTLTDGPTITIDLSDLYKIYKVTIGATGRILALINAYSGRRFLVHVGQDPTGNRTITQWPNKTSTFAPSDVTIGTDVIVVGRNIPTGTPIKFSTTGTLPTGLTAATKYYAINSTSTAIKVATTLALAQAGTQIDITGTGSGTHTLSTETAWTNDTEPTLQTGKYQSDTFGFIVADATNGIYYGYNVGAGFPNTY
jgi:hypothetical protein